MKRQIITLLLLFFGTYNLFAQFVQYTAMEFPKISTIQIYSEPKYTPPALTIIDNSIDITNDYRVYNSHSSSTPKVKCVESQSYNGQILLIDLTDDSDASVVDAEVSVSAFSDKSISIYLNKIKLNNKWVSIGIYVNRLADLLEDASVDRKAVLALLKYATYFAIKDGVLFLF